MNWLDLIMEEFFMNVVRHAYPAGHSGDVELAYAVAGHGELSIEISDSGIQFNPLDGTQPDFSKGIAERPLGGMGIFLVKKIAESLTYQRLDSRNLIRFTYVRPAPNGS